MAVVTYTLSDFKLDSLNAFHPVVRFVPSGPGVSAQRLLSAKPVESIPNAGGSGSVDLYPSDWTLNDTWYTIQVQRLTAYGTEWDVLPWKFRVPPAGGWIGDMFDVDANPAFTWIGPTPPENTAQWMLWIDTSVMPPVLKEWRP